VAASDLSQRDLSQKPASNKVSEADLLRGLQAKEEWAYQELMDRWSEKLYRVAYRFLKRVEEAQEILQEVFEKVITNIQTFQGQSSLYTWLYRITVNQALMRLRKEGDRQLISWEDEKNQFEDGIWRHVIPDWSQIPDNLFDKQEVQEFVHACIEELSEDTKTAYLLKDGEGLAEDEVCAILDISKAAMKNRVHRARLYLRKKLEERYVTPD
jgi:RNA polymerase sigma-70 factor, ECF subfamily